MTLYKSSHGMELYMRLQKRFHDMELILQKGSMSWTSMTLLKVLHGMELYASMAKNSMMLQKKVSYHAIIWLYKKMFHVMEIITLQKRLYVIELYGFTKNVVWLTWNSTTLQKSFHNLELYDVARKFPWHGTLWL